MNICCLRTHWKLISAGFLYHQKLFLIRKEDFSFFFLIFQLHIDVSGICFLFVLFQRTRCIFYVGLLSFLHFNGMSVALQRIAAQAFAELCRRNLRIPEQDILHILFSAMTSGEETCLYNKQVFLLQKLF